MTNGKTKKAFVTSSLSLLLCCAMLIGTTFAWFTDSATGGNSKIVAGNLDVELEYATAFDADGEPSAWDSVENTANLFNPTNTDDRLWEPGHTEVVYLRIRNAGSLALKYNLSAAVYGDAFGAPENIYENQAGGYFKLSEYLVFNTIPDTVTKLESREDAWLAGGQSAEESAAGKLDSVSGKDIVLKKGEEKVFTLAVYMPTWVGNAANYKTNTAAPEIYISLNLTATQAAVESDSFGSKYDENAEYPVVEQAALADGSALFTFPGLTPTGEEATTVEFPAESFNTGDKLSLVVETTLIDVDAIEDYPTVNDLVPVGSVKLSLLVNGEPQTDFNGKTASVTTYIAEEAEDVTVRYTHDGAADADEYMTDYEAGTGKVSFETTHFSEFVAYAADRNASNYKYTATLLDGMKLNAEIKNTANGTSSATFRGTDNTVKSITFSAYDKDVVGADWETGKPVDAAGVGDIRLFLVGGSTNVYICAQPDTQILMNADSRYMFMNLYALTAIDFGGDLVSASDVTGMFNMFYSCKALGGETFKQIGSWDVSKVSDMSGMFRGCSLLTEIDLSDWNTASLESISSMFMGDTKLTSVDLTGWDASNIKEMNGLFSNCSDLTTITGLSGWHADRVTTMDSMFHTCESLTELDLGGFNSAELTSLKSAFTNCYALEKIEGLENWNTSHVTDMSSLFLNCYALTELDLTGFVTSSVTNMQSMFNSCKTLTTITGMRTWDTSSVTNMSSLFSACESMTAFDLSGWNTSKVKDMGSMFQGCSAATEITVAGWTVVSGTKTSFMFTRCSALEKIYTDKDWGITGSSTYIFSDCKLLTGGKGTKWTKSYESNANYARIDRDGVRGFFTDIADKT